LMRAAGCDYINIAIESASSTMLKGMNRRYKVDDVREALNCFARSDMPYGISLMFGCPGETPETIAETLEVIDSFPVPPDGVWVTIGICLWTERQAVVEDARQAGQLVDDAELFEGAYYMSPDLPETYMLELISALSSRKGYTVQVNKAYATHEYQAN
ncbi:MAG TPA: radical SAM protein, partial [Anaerolineae bacterium]|nr:radical SAM protein [Anaerolineae bacterium]